MAAILTHWHGQVHPRLTIEGRFAGATRKAARQVHSLSILASFLAHTRSAIIDQLKKTQAAKPKNPLEEIPHLPKITNLQHDMGLAQDRKSYLLCRVHLAFQMDFIDTFMIYNSLWFTMSWCEQRRQNPLDLSKAVQVVRDLLFTIFIIYSLNFLKVWQAHLQLQQYKCNWATFEIMKTLIKNKRTYQKKIVNTDQADGEESNDEQEVEEDEDDEKGGSGDEGNDKGGKGGSGRSDDKGGHVNDTGRKYSIQSWYENPEGTGTCRAEEEEDTTPKKLTATAADKRRHNDNIGREYSVESWYAEPEGTGTCRDDEEEDTRSLERVRAPGSKSKALKKPMEAANQCQ